MRRAVSFVRLRDEHDTIIKADLRNAVDSRFRPIFALRALGVRDVTASFFDRVVAHHINELNAQSARTPSGSASLSPRYTIPESVNSELNIGAAIVGVSAGRDLVLKGPIRRRVPVAA